MGFKGCLTTRVRLVDVCVPRGNLLGAEGQGAFLPSGASIGIFATAAMRRAFDIAYRFALTEEHPIIRHLMDVLSYPIIEGGNVGVRRRQLQALFRAPATTRSQPRA